MKFAKITTAVIGAAMLLAGCANEGLSVDNNGGSEPLSDKGTLLIAELQVECVTDKREPEVGLSSATRATTQVDINAFDCVIINEEGDAVLEFKYGERPMEAIELPTGGYTFKIQSDEVPTDAALWEQPIYGKAVPFKIVRNTETPLTNIVCTLMQIQVSVSYSADLLERLGEKTTTTITVGGNSLEYALTERRSGFFYAPLDNNDVTLELNGTYSADGNPENAKSISMTKVISNVKAGQYSDILLYIEHAASGTINVTAQIKDWVVDEVIGTMDFSALVSESIIDENAGSGDVGGDGGNEDEGDKDAPVIVWQGYGFEERYPIENDTTVELDITAPRGIKEFLCTIDSEVLTPDQLLDNNLCNVLNLCDATKSYDSRNPSVYIDVKEALDQLSIDNGDRVLGQTYVHLSISQFIPVLKVTGKGKHNFVLTVTDNEGVTTTRTLLLVTE